MNKIRLSSCLLFLALLITSSCSTIDKIDRKGQDLPIDANNFQKLNGSFSKGANLFDLLNDRKAFPKKLKTDSTMVVTISVINNKAIKLEFVTEGKTVNTTTLNGSFVKGYFSNTKISVFLKFFPLLWGPGSHELRLGLTKDNNLAVLESHGGIAIFLVLPFFGGGGEGTFELKRKID